MQNRHLFLIPIIALFASCHSGHYATIDYMPIQTSSMPKENHIVVQLRVIDSRERPTVVGDYTTYVQDVVIKGLFYTMRKEKNRIYAHTDPALVLEKALAIELTNLGFTVSERSNADVIVEVDLRSFYNRFEKTGIFLSKAISQMKMNVKTLATATEKTDFAKSISGEGVNANIFYWDGYNASVALQAALEDGVQKLFQNPNFLEALHSLLSQEKPLHGEA